VLFDPDELRKWLERHYVATGPTSNLHGIWAQTGGRYVPRHSRS
jgi:hypothetical protein